MIISRYTQLPRLLNRAASHQFSTITTTGPVTQFLTDQVNTGTIQHDASQFHLAAKLDTLHDQLSATDASVLSDDQLSVETELVHRTYATPLEKFAAYSRKTISTCFKQQLRPTPKGLYVHGSVGVGKTFTMDAFFDLCHHNHSTIRRKQKRAHFHEFMLDVHARIHQFKQLHPKTDPIPAVALSIAKESQVSYVSSKKIFNIKKSFCFDYHQLFMTVNLT